jgi:endonuclease YncB( thermonuclease family)
MYNLYMLDALAERGGPRTDAVQADGALVWDKKDRFGRTIGKVMVDGTDACLEQIKAGWAWHYKRYASEQPAQDRADYAAAEDRAKGERIGLWSDAQPTAPWDSRREK